MARAVYVCGDVVGAPGGAGTVTLHELNALKAAFEDVTVLDGTVLTPHYYRHLGIPFLQDYFTVAHLKKLGPFSHGHFYSNGFTQAVWWLREHGATVSYSTPAHDPVASVAEFHRSVLPDHEPFPFPHIADPELYRLHGQGLVDADLVIAASSGSKAEVQRLRGQVRDDKTVVVIPHGVIYPDIVPSFPEKLSVGYLGQTGPDKGLVYLLRAMNILRDRNIRLVIAGWGGGDIEEMVRKEMGQGEVLLIGYVEKLADFFAQVSVYCQPSVTEGFGIPVLEAMAYGRPVIASLGAGASDIVNQAGGICVMPGDSEEMAEAISLFADCPKIIDVHGARNRLKAACYSWDRIEAQYREIFQKFRGVL